MFLCVSVFVCVFVYVLPGQQVMTFSAPPRETPAVVKWPPTLPNPAPAGINEIMKGSPGRESKWNNREGDSRHKLMNDP